MDFSAPDSLPSELRQEARERELVSGEVLFHHQDTAQYVFALKKGRIRIERSTCEGNLVIFNIVRAGESFAESALFTKTYHWNAVVEIPSSVIYYPKNIVWQVLNDQPHLALKLLPKLDRQSQSLEKLLLLRSIRSARDRLLQYILLFTASEQKKKVVFDRSYKNIADELGLSSETLYRTLADLEKSGIICREGREIKLLTAAKML